MTIMPSSMTEARARDRLAVIANAKVILNIKLRTTPFGLNVWKNMKKHVDWMDVLVKLQLHRCIWAGKKIMLDKISKLW
jgi:hypothetical protein